MQIIKYTKKGINKILMKNGVYIGTYPIKIAILGGIVGFTITVIAFRYVKTKLNKKSMFCELEIYFENKDILFVYGIISINNSASIR